MLNPEGSGKFPASHLGPEPSLPLYHVFPSVLPDVPGVLPQCGCAACLPFLTGRSDGTRRRAAATGQGKGFGIGYQRTESARSLLQRASSSKPFLLAASQLPHISKMWTAVFPTLCKVHGAEGVKNPVSGLVSC